MKKQQGFSLIELLIVVAIIGIIAAIAIPNLLNARQSANESSAIGSCRTIATAETTYISSTNSYGEAADLATAKLIDASIADQAATAKSGYYVTFSDVSTSAFAITVHAEGTNGTRRFGIVEDGVARYDATTPNGASDHATILTWKPIGTK